MEIVAEIFRKIKLLLLVIPILTLSGCDFFRRAAGRPDSGELVAVKAEVTRRIAAERDSIARVKAREDSLKAERERAED